MTTQNLPIVTIVDGAVTTLSTDVADFFEKPHYDVLKSIRAIVENLPANRLGNFSETVVTRANPSGGAPIKSKAYRLTRDGFTFLAMGFTGAKAQAFKWAYIDAFNKMEAALYQRPAKDQLPPPMLTEQQAYQIMSEVAKRAKSASAHYQTIYHALKARYQVTKYTHIPSSKFEDAINFIRTCDLRVPEKAPEPPKATEKTYTVTASFLKILCGFIYEWRYLHRSELEQFYRLMIALKSPLAPSFYEAIASLNLARLEKNLESLGFPVQDLDCYKHWALTHDAA